MTSQGHTLSVIWKALTTGHSRTFFSNWKACCLRAEFQIWLVSTFYYECSFALQILLYIWYSSACEYEISTSSSLKSVLASWLFWAVNKNYYQVTVVKSNRERVIQCFSPRPYGKPPPFTKLYASKGTELTKDGSSSDNFFQWCAYSNYNTF